ncbi:MAG: alpha/beta fold hydrolase [Bryobacteraceae bacterium]|nr:alpha/beta fold hydrolase [Bryobacteraceae bacterium]
MYRSPAGRQRIQQLYDAQLRRLGIAAHSRFVPTRFGNAHVLAIGPEDAPPLVTWHGAQFSGPFHLELFRDLARSHRVYVADTPGQSGRSDPARLLPFGQAYGRWAGDVLDGLRIERATMAGVSYGGAILLDLAAWSPSRIEKAVLIVPAGLVVDWPWRLASRLLVPFLKYRRAPGDRTLREAMEPIGVDLEDHILELYGAAIEHLKLPSAPPGLFSERHLKKFTAPVLCFLAEDDCFFPYTKAKAKVGRVFGPRARVVTLPGKHFPAKATRGLLSGEIERFLHSAQPEAGV